jgi:hypothetical protein
MRNAKEIRTSFYLAELYDAVFKPANWNNYKEYNGFANFNASYEYEIFEVLYN